MRYSFRLAEVVGHVPDPRKRPGTIKNICEFTGLDRHQVASLLKNEIKYVPLDALSKLCEFLIDRGYATADDLPGRLFGVEPEHFWELLARRKRLVLCLGVRRGEEGSLNDAWVVASDSVLLGELLSGVTTLGGTAKHRRPIEPAGSQDDDRTVAAQIRLSGPPIGPHPEHLHQTLVWSPGQADGDQVRAMARTTYESFTGTAGDKALVCLGSIKSNPMVELLLANAFGCEPFESQDSIAAAGKRSCPIFLRYRDDDPHPPSCCGGLRLAAPGASFEGAGHLLRNGRRRMGLRSVDGHDQRRRLRVLHPPRVARTHGNGPGRLLRPGDATLGAALARRGEEFWPPVYEGQGIQIGSFVVKWPLPDEPHAAEDLLRTDLQVDGEIIRLDGEVIARRMQQVGEAE